MVHPLLRNRRRTRLGCLRHWDGHHYRCRTCRCRHPERATRPRIDPSTPTTGAATTTRTAAKRHVPRMGAMIGCCIAKGCGLCVCLSAVRENHCCASEMKRNNGIYPNSPVLRLEKIQFRRRSLEGRTQHNHSSWSHARVGGSTPTPDENVDLPTESSQSLFFVPS